MAPEPFASQTRGSVYDAEISAMDASIGDLLAALDRLNRARSAHVILVADHGEGLGQHFGYEEHGLHLYEEANRVPMLWRTPEQHSGRRSSAWVGGIDIAPTILDLVKAQPTDTVEGTSLAPLLRGRARPERAGLYCETLRPFLTYGWSPLYGWRTATQTFIAAPVPELYDLEQDPAERRNLFGARPSHAESLHNELADYIERWQREELTGRGMLDTDSRDVLESLGYLQLIHNRRRMTEGVPGIDDLSRLADPKTHIGYEMEFIRGRLARRHGRWAEALSIYQRVLGAIPESPAVQIGIADALRGLGRHEEALRWLRDHLTEHPEDAYAQKMIGHVLYELGRYAQANEIFRRFPVDDDDTDLRLARARVAIMLGRFADARAEFHRLREAFRQRTRADDWLVATETLERSGVERPAVTDADLFAQISAMIDLAMIEEARRLMTAAESSERNSAMLAALRGHLAFATRDWRAARDAYNRAVALGMEPDRIRARLDEAESRYQYQRKRSREEEAAVTGRVGVS